MQPLQAGIGAKKKAPLTKEWSLKIGPKPQSKVVADERGRRIRHLPGGHAPREENSAHRPVSHNLGRGRRKRAKSVATRRICSRARAAAMRQTTCQLCALRRERTVLLTEKNMAPLGGKRGLGLRNTLASAGRERIRQRKGGGHCPSALKFGKGPPEPQGDASQGSHAFSAYHSMILKVLVFPAADARLAR